MMQLDPEELHGGGGGPPEREDGGNGEATPDEASEETPEQAATREFRENQARLEQEALRRAQQTINELGQKLSRNEQLSEQEWEEFKKAQGVIDRVIGGGGARPGGAGINPGLRQELEIMPAAEIMTKRHELYERYPSPEEREYIDRQFIEKKYHEQQGAYYVRSAGYMREHWSPAEKREWFHHQMHILLASRTTPTSAEQQLAYESLQYAGSLLGDTPDLQKEYQYFIKLYDHFTQMITTRDFQPIMDSAVSKFKSRDINEMFKLPLLAQAFKVWDQNGSYKEYLRDKAIIGKDGKPLESAIVLTGPGLKLRRLAMTGEMVKWRLARYIAQREGARANEEVDREALNRAKEEVDRKFTGDLSLDFLDSRIHQEPPKPEEIRELHGIDEAEKRKMIEDWNGWAEDQYEQQRIIMLGKINRFIDENNLRGKVPDSFFTTGGQTIEQATLGGNVEIQEGELGEKQFKKRSKADGVFEDAQLSLDMGEAAWRTFERAALMDGMNPEAATPEGGGENPLRRLLSLQKYAQELLKDGKLKHVQPQITEHLVNPVRDFISDPGDAFWRKQPKIVQDWYEKMIRTPGKIDRYGRFLDLSECPIELIDFHYYQEIPDRSPFAPHYSNYAELVEEMRKQEVLGPGKLLETPTLENYINFVKLYRNLRSEDNVEHREAREAESKLASQGKAREPNVSREKASYELFRGLLAYWRENKMMPKESMINSILIISDPFQESFITPKYRDKLIREVYGWFWGTWPLWDIRQQWAKIDWGAGLLNGIKAFFKAVFQQKS